jgi:hypothetical protein
MSYREKYLKYKAKYLALKGGANEVMPLNELDKKLIFDLYKVTIRQPITHDGITYKTIGKERTFGAGPDAINYMRHALIAGMIQENGEMAVGLSSKSPTGVDAHGEPAVASAAYLLDPVATNWKSLVCLVPPTANTVQVKVKSSCGTCRELLRYHYPGH